MTLKILFAFIDIFKLTTGQVLVFNWIAGSYYLVVVLVVQKPVNADPGLKFNCNIDFSLYKCFSLLLFLLKQKAKQYTENLSAKLQKPNQNTFFLIQVLGVQQPGPAAKP